MKRRRSTKKVADPLLRACTACGAGVGEGCKTGIHQKSLTTRNTRLVHADRLEGAVDAAR